VVTLCSRRSCAGDRQGDGPGRVGSCCGRAADVRTGPAAPSEASPLRSTQSRGQRATAVAGVSAVAGVTAEFNVCAAVILAAHDCAHDSTFGRVPRATATQSGHRPVLAHVALALRTTCACLILPAAARGRDTRPEPGCAIGTPITRRRQRHRPTVRRAKVSRGSGCHPASASARADVLG